MISKKNIILIQSMAAVLLFSTYIFQVCNLNQNHYRIAANEQRLAELQEANQEMESYLSLRISEIDIDQVAANYNFEKIDKIDYIESASLSMR